MSLGDEIYNKFEQYRTMLGDLVGRPYDIYRPNYSLMTVVGADEGVLPEDESGDQSGTGSITTTVQGETLIGRRRFHIESVGPKYAEPGMNNCDFVSIFGSTIQLQPGDVFVDPTGTAPTITLVNFSDVKEIVGVRTARIGQIYDDIDTCVVDSIRYEWLKYATPAAAFTDVLSGMVTVPTKKIVVFERPELLPQNFQVQGKRLLETDGTLSPARRWVIKLVESIKPLIVFTLEEEEV